MVVVVPLSILQTAAQLQQKVRRKLAGGGYAPRGGGGDGDGARAPSPTARHLWTRRARVSML